MGKCMPSFALSVSFSSPLYNDSTFVNNPFSSIRRTVRLHKKGQGSRFGSKYLISRLIFYFFQYSVKKFNQLAKKGDSNLSLA